MEKQPEAEPYIVVNEDYTVNVRGWTCVETFDLLTPVDFETKWSPEPVYPFARPVQHRLARTIKVSFEIRERPEPPPPRVYNTVDLKALHKHTDQLVKIRRYPA
jgi:hypothetical protein